MKKTALLLLFAIVLFACCKDDTPTPEPTCYISAITEGTDTLCQFFYDNKMRLVKYIHDFNGTSYMRFFEYNEKGLPVRIDSYDLDSTRLTRYYTLEYNEKDLLKKRLVYLGSQDFEYAGHEEYFYNENNILIKTESYNEGWKYPQFDTYEYDEEGNCIQVYKWYHVYETGEVKLQLLLKYQYGDARGPFKNIPLIFDGFSGNPGIYKYPIITKQNSIFRFESHLEENSIEPFQYSIYNYELNEYNYPIIENSISYWGEDSVKLTYNYHYIIK